MMKNRALVHPGVSTLILSISVALLLQRLNFLLLMAQYYLFSLVLFLNRWSKTSKCLARSVQYFNKILSGWSQIMLMVPNYSSWHIKPIHWQWQGQYYIVMFRFARDDIFLPLLHSYYSILQYCRLFYTFLFALIFETLHNLFSLHHC